MIDWIRKFFAVFFSVFLVLFALFLFDARRVENLPSGLVCEDIVVLTGGKNRIKLALDSVKKFHAKSVLISGVYKGTKLEDILGDAKDISAEDLGDVTIILGYKAQNTEGNAKEIREVAEDLGMKEIILVTSDYHMFRSLHEVKKYNRNLKIYPMKVMSTFNLKFIVLCFKEFYYSLGVLILDSMKGIAND